MDETLLSEAIVRHALRYTGRPLCYAGYGFARGPLVPVRGNITDAAAVARLFRDDVSRIKLIGYRPTSIVWHRLAQSPI
ncbi:hypothetical protein X947_319 [Burkholderia pseudomallei MSHR7334]|nr:hypothetical protein X947_319 [Burkholderia pseudomallei MSHR7334]